MSYKTLRLAAFTAAVFFAMSASAFAQTKILVVDTGKVIQDSTVGKYAEGQLNSIGKSMQAEIKRAASPLESKSKTIKTAIEGKKSVAEIQQTFKARPDLQKQLQELEVGKRKMAQESQVKSYEFTATERKAYMQIAKKVQTIIDQVARERGADLVLEKTATLYAGSSVDITSTVLSRLNSQMTTVSVTRERMPRN